MARTPRPAPEQSLIPSEPCFERGQDCSHHSELLLARLEVLRAFTQLC